MPVRCVIGVHPHERGSTQELLVSVELDTDFSTAAATDDLADTLDYTRIAETVERCAVEGRFQLIETLAERLADLLLTTTVDRVTVEIEKPAALGATRHVGVRVSRSRG